MPIRVCDIKEGDEHWQVIDLPDRLDRRDLRPVLGGLSASTLMASWGVRLREVPGDYWNLDDQTAVIACPCGESPMALALAPLTECSCGRFFFFDASNVWVLGSPTPPEPENETPVVN